MSNGQGGIQRIGWCIPSGQGEDEILQDASADFSSWELNAMLLKTTYVMKS